VAGSTGRPAAGFAGVRLGHGVFSLLPSSGRTVGIIGLADVSTWWALLHYIGHDPGVRLDLRQPPACGERRTSSRIFSRELPNVPGKALTAVQVDYAAGGASKPHHHSGIVFDSGIVFAYVVSGEMRSQVDSEPPHQRAGQTARLLVADQGAVLTIDDR
jgi:hypothetical protein